MKECIRKVYDAARSLSTGKMLLGVFLLAWAVRLANSETWSDTLSYRTFCSRDEMDYDTLSRNLLEFGRFGAYTEGNLLRSLRPPAYPLFLACLHAVTGRGYLAVRLFQSLLDACNAVLLYGIASRLSLRRGGALLAAVCYALYGPPVHYGSFLTGEIFALFLLNVSLLCLLSCRTAYRPKALAVSAAALGVLIHCRPAFLGVIPFFLAAVGVVAPARRKARSALVFGAVVVAALIPWSVRNLCVHKVMVPVSTIPAWHVAVSCRGDDLLSVREAREYLFSHGDQTEGEMCQVGTRMGIRYLLANPVRCFVRGLGRVLYSWTFPDWRDRFWRARAYVNVVRVGPLLAPLLDFEGVFYVSVVFLIIGAVRARKIWPSLRKFLRAALPIALIVTGYTLFHFVSIPMIQYRLMIEPYLILLAIGFGWCVLGGDPCDGGEALAAPWPCPPRWAAPALLSALVVLAAVGVAGAHRFRSEARRKTSLMSELLAESRTPTLQDVRDYQFRHLGGIGPLVGKEITWVGEVTYPAAGYLFNPIASETFFKPVEAPNSGVFRLLVDRYDPKAPLGSGDVCVNVPREEFREGMDGALVRVTGRIAGTSCFGGIIVNAERVVDWPRSGSQHE